MSSIQLDDPLAYEYVSMLLDEYESAALDSGSRSGIMANMYGATYTSEPILDAQEKSLSRVDKAREFLSGKGEGITLVDTDVDFAELVGGSDSAVANYIQDCLNCNLRLKFDWQLQPFNLLGPIEDFLDDINLSIDRLLARLDPWKNLEEICHLLNSLKAFCPQDLILLMMSLKMLLKKYLLNMFSIKIDWTTLLGPLLKALLSAITDLLDNLFALIAAPIDCALSGLKASNDIYKATQSLINDVQNSGSQLNQAFQQLKHPGGNSILNEDLSGLLYKDVTWEPPVIDEDGYSSELPGIPDPGIGKLNVGSRLDADTKPNEGEWTIPAGFMLTSKMTTLDALRDPTFVNSSPIEKLIIPVQEALNWLKELYSNFIASLKSLEALCSGSLSVKFDNLGVMLFILDMISLILMIIKILSSNSSISDWCTHLENNPHLLESQLRNRYGSGVSVSAVGGSGEKELLIRQGPDIVGVVKTCASSRTGEQGQLINQWIKELDQKGLA